MPRLPKIASGPVPASFILAWNELVERCEALERRVEELERGGAGLPPIVIARAGGSGLAAATDANTPRKGTATLRVFNGTTLADGPQVEYFNMATEIGRAHV